MLGLAPFSRSTRAISAPPVCVVLFPGVELKNGIWECTFALSVSVTRLWLSSLHPSRPSAIPPFSHPSLH